MGSKTTIVAEGVRFLGDIAGNGDVAIFGRFEGAIRIGGELFVAPKAVARAEVVASRVRVEGLLDGRVRASGQVAIGAQGCIIGEVQGMLVVEEGGVFQGRLDVESTASDLPPPAGQEPPEPRKLVRPMRLVDTVPPQPPPVRRQSPTSSAADGPKTADDLTDAWFEEQDYLLSSE